MAIRRVYELYVGMAVLVNDAEDIVILSDEERDAEDIVILSDEERDATPTSVVIISNSDISPDKKIE